MQVIKLASEEARKTGCSHLAIIDFTDLNTTAAASKALTLYSGGAREIVDRAILDLVTPFDGGATSALKLDLGYNGATVDDADAFIDNIEVHQDATEILADAGTVDPQTVDATYGAQEQAVIETLRARRPYASLETFAIEALFTATGGNLTLLDTGKARIYFNVVKLSELRNINGL